MKIGIVGSGLVGATAAYALVMRGIGRQIVLVDLDKKRAQAEADDLLHAVPFAHPMEVSAGEYEDLADSRVVIVSAGVGQKPGETRLQLLGRNAKVFQQVIPIILKNSPEAILIITTNPVDVMTHLAARFASQHGVASSRVIGSGTMLDTARFRALLGRSISIDPQHIHAYVLGEHGDSEVLTWSLVTVGGMDLDEFCKERETAFCDEDFEVIEDQVRRAAYNIIEGKGATYYGVGSAIARLVEVILRDQRSILTVCTPIPEVAGVKDITVSLPNLVGGQGIVTTFYPDLNDKEHMALKNSAEVIRDALDGLEKEMQT
ncbi:MAG TPA: L-lactate dehydrogenase [Anaerolineales bacterium]